MPGEEIGFIIGNPPFAGARVMNKTQKEELQAAFNGLKNVGDLDYVTCWFIKANKIMEEFEHIKTAFVATNSITQGIQPSLLWKPIFDTGSHINFAYKTFKWQSEARGKAAVHCVIVGFDRKDNTKKIIFDGDKKIICKSINGYLVDAENICVESRQTPISDIPEIGIGNKPVDGRNFLFSRERKNAFLDKEPQAEKYFRKWLGAEEFIHNKERYCLWLGDCLPNELNNMPECLKVIGKVKEFRENSQSGPTQKLARYPAHFHVENMPKTDYLIIPKTSSETRNYIPIGFETPETLCGDALFIVPNATSYHFGILTSSVHNAWVRAIAGRLKSDIRYSKDIVYNNFPWPEANDKQKTKIGLLANNILETRAKFPNSTLADLYNQLTMPAELLKAHRKLDKVVLKLYGLPASSTDSEIVSYLLKKYKERAG